MMYGDINEPPFIQGLKVAKNILVSLRQRKVKQAALREPLLATAPLQSSSDKQNKEPQQQLIQQQKSADNTQKHNNKQLLCQKINQIGKQLHDCHTENESYEVILNDMAEYYRQNMEIVEENEKLKHKGYELKQKIEDYKTKIQCNYQIIEQHRIQEDDLHSLTASHLREYLLFEIQKGLQQPLPPLSPSSCPNKLISYQKQEKQAQIGLTLRWKSLAKQVARKQVLPRKQPLQEEDVRRSFYHSEVYNL